MVLLHLEGQDAGARLALERIAEVDLDGQGVEQLGHGLRRELDVHHRAGDPCDAADASDGLGLDGHVLSSLLLRRRGRRRRRRSR